MHRSGAVPQVRKFGNSTIFWPSKVKLSFFIFSFTFGWKKFFTQFYQSKCWKINHTFSHTAITSPILHSRPEAFLIGNQIAKTSSIPYSPIISFCLYYGLWVRLNEKKRPCVHRLDPDSPPPIVLSFLRKIFYGEFKLNSKLRLNSKKDPLLTYVLIFFLQFTLRGKGAYPP